jgi:hypothetical protein
LNLSWVALMGLSALQRENKLGWGPRGPPSSAIWTATCLSHLQRPLRASTSLALEGQLEDMTQVGRRWILPSGCVVQSRMNGCRTYSKRTQAHCVCTQIPTCVPTVRRTGRRRFAGFEARTADACIGFAEPFCTVDPRHVFEPGCDADRSCCGDSSLASHGRARH